MVEGVLRNEMSKSPKGNLVRQLLQVKPGRLYHLPLVVEVLNSLSHQGFEVIILSSVPRTMQLRVLALEAPSLLHPPSLQFSSKVLKRQSPTSWENPKPYVATQS